MADIPILKLRPLSRIGMGKFGGHIEIDFKGVRTKIHRLSKLATGRQAKKFRDAWVDECLTLIGDEMAETWKKQPGWRPNTKAWETRKQNMATAGTGAIANKVGQFSGALNTVVLRGGQAYLTGGETQFMRQAGGTRGTNSTGFHIVANNVREKLRPKQAPLKGSERSSKYPVYFNREHRFIPTLNEIKKIGNKAFVNTLRKKHPTDAWIRKIRNKALLKGTGL
jgi:hypothetical protein